MDESTSDTTHVEDEPGYYKMTPEEMRTMKHSLEIMQSRLGSLWVLMGRAHIDPILTELSVVNKCISKTELSTDNMYVTSKEFVSITNIILLRSSTPEASDSDSNSGFDHNSEFDSIEFNKSIPIACETLIEGGVEHLVARMIEGLETQDDEIATGMANFIRGSSVDEALALIEKANIEEPHFITHFRIRGEKILIELYSRQMEATYAKELRARFSKI